jgi:peroxiredoxin Q/BCP
MRGALDWSVFFEDLKEAINVTRQDSTQPPVSKPSTHIMAQLKPGMKAPEFRLPAGDGSTVSLKDLRGKNVILYFYPKDNTSGCTKEACDFRDRITTFTRKGTVVIGVSADSVSSHQKFAERFDLPFALVSDENKEVIKAYGVWKQKSLYGKKYMGIERTTFVIDGNGMITHVFPKVKVQGHIDEILALL